MEEVTFEFAAGEDGHFACHDGDGREIRVEAGKPYTTSDPHEIRELDAAPHAVKRVKSGKPHAVKRVKSGKAS
jgi:hypothetical protein